MLGLPNEPTIRKSYKHTILFSGETKQPNLLASGAFGFKALSNSQKLKNTWPAGSDHSLSDLKYEEW